MEEVFEDVEGSCLPRTTEVDAKAAEDCATHAPFDKIQKTFISL